MKKIFFIFLIGLTSCQSTYYIVRHAEKATQPANNPPLTEAGKQRAIDLKELLLNEGISEIYSTQTLRTESTAKPLSDSTNKPIQSYNATDQAQFIEKLKKSDGRKILIVGHSNTVRHLVNGLVEKDTLRTDIPDNDYDNLYVVKRNIFPFGSKKFESKTYGKPSPN